MKKLLGIFFSIYLSANSLASIDSLPDEDDVQDFWIIKNLDSLCQIRNMPSDKLKVFTRDLLKQRYQHAFDMNYAMANCLIANGLMDGIPQINSRITFNLPSRCIEKILGCEIDEYTNTIDQCFDEIFSDSSNIPINFIFKLIIQQGFENYYDNYTLKVLSKIKPDELKVEFENFLTNNTPLREEFNKLAIQVRKVVYQDCLLFFPLDGRSDIYNLAFSRDLLKLNYAVSNLANTNSYSIHLNKFRLIIFKAIVEAAKKHFYLKTLFDESPSNSNSSASLQLPEKTDAYKENPSIVESNTTTNMLLGNQSLDLEKAKLIPSTNTVNKDDNLTIIETLNDQIKQLNEQFSFVSKEHEVFKSQNDELKKFKSQIMTKDKEIQKLQQSKLDLNRQVDNLNKQDAIDQEIVKNNTDLEKKINAKKDKYEKYSAELAKQRNYLEEEKQLSQKKVQIINDRNKQITEIRARYADLEKKENEELMQMQEKIKAEEAKISELNQAYAAEKNTHTQLHKNIKQFQSDFDLSINNKDQLLKDINDKIINLQKECNILKSIDESNQKLLQQKDEQINSFKGDSERVDSLQAEIDEILKDISQKKKQITDLNELKHNLNSNKDSHNDEQDNAEKAILLIAQLANRDQNVVMLHDQINNLQTNLVQLHQENSGLSSLISKAFKGVNGIIDLNPIFWLDINGTKHKVTLFEALKACERNIRVQQQKIREQRALEQKKT